ncbi:MAG: helix-turn-helix domain-containing protein [Candidatus Fimenecus sp.]
MSTSISSRLVSLRKDKNLSQKEAAQALGISQALLSHYEKGIRECGLDFLCRASAFYDVSSDYLLGISETKIVSDALFELNDIPQDGELRMSTIFRASVFLTEKMSGSGNNYSQQIRDIYILTLYKIYISALNKGLLPANGKIAPDVAPFLSSSMLDYLLSTLFTASSDAKPKKSENLPLCVETVVTEALRLIESQIDSIYSAANQSKCL